MTATVSVGGHVTLVATAFDLASEPISGVPFTWTSTDPASGDGQRHGRRHRRLPTGDAVIIATAANGVAGSAAIHVDDAAPPILDVHINEIHYDNVGTDTGEAIEIEGPAGTTSRASRVVLYNGNGGVPYNTQTLSGVLPTSCGTRGVVVVSYPPDGIQNGAPDGIALVNASGQVLEFLSYEGAFTATSRPGRGHRRSVDIVASQANAALGQSLQRNSDERVGSRRVDIWRLQSGDARHRRQLAELQRPHRPAIRRCRWVTRISCSRRCAIRRTQTIPTTITWTSETPAIASIDQNGVLHALAEGTAIRARDGGRRHHGYLLAAHARGGGERRRSTPATPSSANRRTPTPATTSSCVTSSSRRRTTRIAARRTG